MLLDTRSRDLGGRLAGSTGPSTGVDGSGGNVDPGMPGVPGCESSD